MLRFRLTPSLIRHLKRRHLVYRPDFMVHEWTETEYQRFWAYIKSASTKALYTDGLKIYPVGWFWSTFEWLKGLLGFENHCQANKVELTLAKIAYQGYLRGYTAEYRPLELISPHFMARIHSDRQDETTQALQSELMDYYFRFAEAFHLNTDDHQPLNPNEPIHGHDHIFGAVYLSTPLIDYLPGVDPQDQEVIRLGIDKASRHGSSLKKPAFLKASAFGACYAEVLMKKQKLVDALRWSPSIETKYPVEFIQHYLRVENKNYDAVIRLTAGLHDASADAQWAIEQIAAHFTLEEQIHGLQHEAKLRKQLAQVYLQKAQEEKSRYSFSKLLWGDNYANYLTHVVNLDPSILENEQGIKKEMREEVVMHVFKEAIQNGQYDKAANLYEKNPGVNFSIDDLIELKDHLVTAYHATTQHIQKAVDEENDVKTQQISLDNVARARLIGQLASNDNFVVSAKIAHAKVLLKIDEKKPIKHANLDALEQIEKIFRELNHLGQSAVVRSSYNQLLTRAIDCLIEKVKVPITFMEDNALRRRVLSDNQSWIEQLKCKLKTYIQYNEAKASDPNICPVLAKMCYLLGDVFHFFDLDRISATPYVKRAAELMPNNAYYALKCDELGVKGYDEAWQKISEDVYPTMYNEWVKERWMVEQFVSQGFDIHDTTAQQTSLMSTLLNLFR